MRFWALPADRLLGAGGVVLLMVALLRSLSVALLFLLATSVHHRTGTFSMDDMGGLAQKTPVLAALFVAATLASIGLPGFANFWGELTIFIALWQYSHALTAVAVAGIVISAVYGLRAAARVFFGSPTEAFQKVCADKPPVDLSLKERIPALILLATLLLIGFWPKSFSTGIDARSLLKAPLPSLTWPFANRPSQWTAPYYRTLANQNQWGAIAPELMLGCLALLLLGLEIILPKDSHKHIPGFAIVGILGIIAGFAINFDDDPDRHRIRSTGSFITARKAS